MRLKMKLIELGIDINNQLKTPQSPGSRGVALSKSKPPKRYFDYIVRFPKQINRQK